MIGGDSLNDIARALKMAQDQEGRPALSADEIEILLRDVMRMSSKLPRAAIEERLRSLEQWRGDIWRSR